MPFIHSVTGVTSRVRSSDFGTTSLNPNTALMVLTSGCMSPIHTSRSRLMPSHRYSCMFRWTV